jgi:hypothetical protein
MLYFLGITSYLSDIYTNFRGRRNNSIFVDMLIREFSASFSTYIYTIYTYMYTVPDLPLCLGVLKPVGEGGGGGGDLPAKKKITMDFCLYHAILNY